MPDTLFTVPTANGQRASIALTECDIDFAATHVDLYAGQHRNADMLALNPFGRMPVLQLEGGETIYGSLAIGLHAAESSGMLLPDESERAQFHQWCGIIMTDLVPAFAAQFYLGTLAPQPDPWGLDWYREIIERFLAGIDRRLADHEYFLGGGYSLADVLMYPTAVTSVARTDAGLAPYPAIARWAAAIGARGAVQSGMAASAPAAVEPG